MIVDDDDVTDLDLDPVIADEDIADQDPALMIEDTGRNIAVGDVREKRKQHRRVLVRLKKCQPRERLSIGTWSVQSSD